MHRIVLACLASLLVLCLAPGVASAADAPTDGLRYPSLTPDGQTVVFAYRGDIWVAAVDGKGPVRRLTIHEAQDTLPRVSPDGKLVAFASQRGGGYDVYVVPIDGGVPRQVTFHGGAEVDCDWSPDGKRLLIMAARTPSLEGMDLYEVDVSGGTPRPVTEDGGREGSWHPDGKRVVYARGFNTIYQDDYQGGANYDLYTVPEPGALPERLTETPGNERYPCYSADGSTIYFVAEEHGVSGFYAMPASGGPRKRLTSFREDVLRPDLGWDGHTVVFEMGGRLCVTDLASPKPEARALPIIVRSDVRHSGVVERRLTSGPEQLDVSPDGTTLVFSVHGDLWTMPASGGEGRRLTSGPENDEWPRYSPDGRKIAYQSDKSGNSDIWLLDLATGKKTQLTDHKSDDFFHAWSPDGRRIVFASERSGNRDIWSLEIESGRLEQLTKDPAPDDDPSVSPDGRWVAFDSGRDGAQSIYVMPIDGGDARRVSQGTTFFQVPSFSPNGAMLLFEAYNPATGDSGGLYVASARGGPEMQVTQEGTGGRWDPKGGWVYYTVRGDEGTKVYRHPAPTSIDMGEPVPFEGRVDVEVHEELGQLFDEIWQHLKDGFYDPRMHGVDWDAMRRKYRPLAVDAEIKDEFQNVVRQMLAELKASHLGISGGEDDEAEGVRPEVVETGQLGMELDAEPQREGGYRVASVVPGGPADQTGLRVGDVVTGLAGKTLNESANLDKILAGTVHHEVPIVFRPLTATGLEQERKDTLTPASWQDMGNLVYRNWVVKNQRKVHDETKGQVGYIHLQAMNGQNLMRFQQAVAAWNRDRRVKAMILDVRDNGGGNIHQQLMEVLMARPFMQLQARETGQRVTQPALYWDKPVVLLVNERSFSDAEVFPYAFQTAKLGKIVGMPTAGGVIGTNDITLSDGSTLRIPRVGWWGMDGKELEGHGVVPDLVVPETPEDRRLGRDPQLASAIGVVKREIGQEKPAPEGPKPEGPTSKPPVPATPEPETPPKTPPAASRHVAADAENPLADAVVGEWVRYRLSFGGTETVVRYQVADVSNGQVRIDQQVESGGAFLPPIPDEVALEPVVELLKTLGDVTSTSPTRGVGSDGERRTARLALTFAWGGTPIDLVFTNDVPVLGLLSASLHGTVVLEAIDWSGRGAETPATSPEPPAESSAPPGDVTSPGSGSAAPASSSAAGATAPPNPLDDAQVGEWARYRQTTSRGEITITLEVTRVDADEVGVKATIEHQGQVVEGPERQQAKGAGFSFRGAEDVTWSEEDLTVAGKDLHCRVATFTTRRGGTTKRWFSTEIPVAGLVREERDGKVVRELLAWGTDGRPRD